MSNPSRPNPSALMDLSFSFGKTHILQAAVDLDLFTHIDNGHDTAIELARACGGTTRGTRILANSLVGLRVLEKNGDRYVLTDTARTFLSHNSRAYLGGWVAHMDQLKESWSHLTDTIRTGLPPHQVQDERHGADFFAKFVGSLFVMSKPGADLAAQTVVDNRRGLKILDVGAGSGVWGISFALRDHEAHVTVADFAQVIDVTKRFVAEFGLTGRFDYIPGNFRDTDFGENKYDVAILGHILHSEGEKHSKQLLRKIRRALKPNGQLVIGEFLVDDNRQENELSLLFAVNMLVNTEEGDTFSFKEIGAWLREAGFGDVGKLDAPAPSPLIVAKVAAAKEKAA